MSKIKVGDIAVCSQGRLGILTNAEKQEIEYPDGTKAEAYVGFYATDYALRDGTKIKAGDIWCSRNPKILGNVEEAIDCLEARRAIDNLIEGTDNHFYVRDENETIDADSNTIGLSLNKLAYVISLWGKRQKFDTPTSLDTREERILMNEKLMLIVTEVAEACEALRNLDYEHMEEELADIIIRTLNLTGTLGINIDEIVAGKMEINRGRPVKHGKDC